MRVLHLIPVGTNIPFITRRMAFFVFSAVLVAASMILLVGRGLNFGIDFEGGIMIDVRTQGPADIGDMRASLSGLGLGEVALQEFGAPNDVLIRVARQPGAEAEQMAAVDTVKQALKAMNIGRIKYRRVEFVGPKVSDELVEAARVDGAGLCRIALHVLLPFTWSMSRSLFVLSTIGAFLTFELVWVMTLRTGGPLNSAQPLVSWLYTHMNDMYFGYAAALSAVVFALTLIGTVCAYAPVLLGWRRR